MSDLSQRTSGTFLPGFGTNEVLADVLTIAGGGGYSPGKTRVQQLSNSPSLVKPWTVYGWTMEIRLGYQFTTSGVAPGSPFGRMGDLWGGLLIDTPLSDSPFAANLPPDLSTFTKIWEGNTDPVRQVAGSSPVTAFQLVPVTFMLPSPVVARSGAQLAMGLVLTPSLWGSTAASADTHQLRIPTAFFSVIYTE